MVSSLCEDTDTPVRVIHNGLCPTLNQLRRAHGDTQLEFVQNCLDMRTPPKLGWRDTRPRVILLCGVTDTGVFAEELRVGSRIAAAAGVKRVNVNTTIANAVTARVAILTNVVVATAISMCVAIVANCSVCLGPRTPCSQSVVLSNGLLPMSPQMWLQMIVLAVFAMHKM